MMLMMRLTSGQVDRISPRGLFRSLRNFSAIHGHPSPSSSSAKKPHLNHNHHRHFLHSSVLSGTEVSPVITMAKYPLETDAAMKDQLRESHFKETCDSKAPKSVSDYLLPHLLNLYGSRATAQDFEIYAPEATFEDPLMFARGVKQIKSAFYSLGKLFGESRIVEYTITENETSPGKIEILIDNKQYYKFLGRDIDVVSLIKLDTENGKIVRHEDWWDKKPLKNGETIKSPILGHLTDATKRASMFATHLLMRFGKDPPPTVS